MKNIFIAFIIAVSFIFVAPDVSTSKADAGVYISVGSTYNPYYGVHRFYRHPYYARLRPTRVYGYHPVYTPYLRYRGF